MGGLLAGYGAAGDVDEEEVSDVVVLRGLVLFGWEGRSWLFPRAPAYPGEGAAEENG